LGARRKEEKGGMRVGRIKVKGNREDPQVHGGSGEILICKFRLVEKKDKGRGAPPTSPKSKREFATRDEKEGTL